jgi:hypothetical protein
LRAGVLGHRRLHEQGFRLRAQFTKAGLQPVNATPFQRRWMKRFLACAIVFMTLRLQYNHA